MSISDLPKLKKQIKELRKEYNELAKRNSKKYEFELAFRRFYNRFRTKEYNSEWPIQRVEEALLHLYEMIE